MLLPKRIKKRQKQKLEKLFLTDNLVVVNLRRVSDDSTYGMPYEETTKEKYIFERIPGENGIIYREIFTDYLTSNYAKGFMLPYVVNEVPFIKLFPEYEGQYLAKVSFLWILNEINNPLTNQKEPSLERKQKTD